METIDHSKSAPRRLAVLSSHLIHSSESKTYSSSSSSLPSCVSSQNLVPPPENLKGELTIIDERTGKKYQVQVSEEGTVKATDFKKGQLFKLMQRLENTTPHFLRCIKPNSKQQPGMYENDLVLQQLRCCGVLEVVRISKSGFPT